MTPSLPTFMLLHLLWASASICRRVPGLSKASVSINEANNHRLQTACLSATVLSLTFTLRRRLKLPPDESPHSAAAQHQKSLLEAVGDGISHNAIISPQHVPPSNKYSVA